MIREVIMILKLVLSVIKSNNVLSVVVCRINFISFVATASKECICKEDWDPGNQEDRMLDQVHNQQGIKSGEGIVDCSNHEFTIIY